MAITPEADDVTKLIERSIDEVDGVSTIDGVGEVLHDLFVKELSSQPDVFWESVEFDDMEHIADAFLGLVKAIERSGVWGDSDVRSFSSHFEKLRSEVNAGFARSWRQFFTKVRKTLDDIYAAERLTFFETRVACSGSADGLTSEIDRLTRGGYEASAGGGVKFRNSPSADISESPSMCAILSRRSGDDD